MYLDDNCFINKCKNNAKCKNNLNGYNCDCESGFDGSNCEFCNDSTRVNLKLNTSLLA